MTHDSVSVLDKNKQLNDFKQACEFPCISLFCYVLCSKLHKRKHIKTKIYSLKFKVTPTKGLIRETNFLRLLIMGTTHTMCP